jgi:DNA (cytosine-5)-methyltransferase 1
MSEPKLTFGSLFAGIGGIDLGFERAGLECKWQVEIDDYATRILAKHWPNVRRHDDIRTWPQPDTERVDVIAGGFPCQDISYAGKGAGLDGARSGLFYELIRVVREVGPRFVVLENVAALLTRGLDQVLGTLASIGFDAEWHCIPAAAIGAPHIRDRLFILAHSQHRGLQKRRGVAMPSTSNQPGRICRHVGTRGEVQAGPVYANTNGEGLEIGERENTIRTWENCRAQSVGGEWWVTEPAVGRVANGIPKRVDRIRGLGNAVVPQVAEWIGRRLLASAI